MRVKNLFVVAVVSAIQYLAALMLLKAVFCLYGNYVSPIRYDIYWGRTLWLSFEYVYLPLILLINLMAVFVPNRTFRRIVYAAGVAALSWFWLEALDSYPYRASFAYILFTAVYIAGIIACHITKKKLETKTK